MCGVYSGLYGVHDKAGKRYALSLCSGPPAVSGALSCFHKVRKTGTWSIKNANDCTAWNKGITVNVEV